MAISTIVFCLACAVSFSLLRTSTWKMERNGRCDRPGCGGAMLLLGLPPWELLLVLRPNKRSSSFWEETATGCISGRFKLLRTLRLGSLGSG